MEYPVHQASSPPHPNTTFTFCLPNRAEGFAQATPLSQALKSRDSLLKITFLVIRRVSSDVYKGRASTGHALPAASLHRARCFQVVKEVDGREED